MKDYWRAAAGGAQAGARAMSSPQPVSSSNVPRCNEDDPKENEMNEQTPSLIDDVMTIGVPVTDQDRALGFYLDRLGFEGAATSQCRRSAGAGSRWRRQAQA